MNLVNFILGFVLMITGRRLFWLFVAVIGFSVGMSLASRLLGSQSSQTLILIIALTGGVIGALLAIFLQRVAIGVSGFLAGGYLAANFMNLLSPRTNISEWLVIVIGGVIGAILLAVLFDWALIFLSSLVGAYLIVLNFQLEGIPFLVVTLILLVLGIVIQTNLMRRGGI